MIQESRLEKSLPLRPRFYKNLDIDSEFALQQMKALVQKHKNQYDFRVSGNHMWIHIPKERKRYYSPHLHVEIESQEDNNQTRLRGLFGPEQSLWTLFMFLHLIVAVVFIAFGVMAYSNWTMKQDNTFNFVMMGLMVVIWFGLYGIARYNRKKAASQMRELYKLIDDIG